MPSPILLISGAAGSGKDTVANFIVQYFGAATIAQADPMKRFADSVFGFTEDQLWGPSESRNAPEPYYDDVDNWNNAWAHLNSYSIDAWLKEVLPNDRERELGTLRLRTWFANMAKDHGLVLEPTLDIFVGKPNRQLTPRYMLQTLGTEWGRHVRKVMWSECAIRTAKRMLTGGWDYSRVHGLTPNPKAVGPKLVVITDGRFRNEIIEVKMAGGTVMKVFNPTPTDDAAKVAEAGVKAHVSETEMDGIPESFYDIMLENDKKAGLLALEMAIVNLSSYLAPKPYRVATNFSYRPQL